MVPKSDLKHLKPTVDVYEKNSYRKVSENDVKDFFPEGILYDEFIRSKMRKIKRNLFFDSFKSPKGFKNG